MTYWSQVIYPHSSPGKYRCVHQIRWLHHLGFKPVSHKKGVYINGHEREDVIKHREALLKTLEDLCVSRPLPRYSDDPPRVRLEANEEKELVIIFHDESIFNTNEGQTWMWGESERPAILPKTKGSGIMVSDFVEEHGGYLKLLPDEVDEAKSQYPNIKPTLGAYLSMVLKKDIGPVNDSWTKSAMPLTTNIGLHTPLCGSLIRAVATKSSMNLLSKQARSWSKTEDVDESEILCGQGASHHIRRAGDKHRQ